MLLVVCSLLTLLALMAGCDSSTADSPTLDIAKAESPPFTSCATDAILIQITPDSSFYFDRAPVTVGEFAVFAKAHQYVTEAEQFGNSGAFDYDQRGWRMYDGATYLQPLGPAGGDAPLDHPATQVSYRDAKAYCAAKGGRLPSAAEWEAAARFKMPAGATLYPWGDDIRDISGAYLANVWQGIFPHTRLVEDGYAYTSPVGSYPAAPSGLLDMAGNVWEWTTDSIPGAGVPGDGMHRVARGGSFLCEPGWCHGYTVSSDTHTSEETGLFHTGFRCLCEA